EGTLASCTNVAGATSQTYVPVAADVGHKLRVQETASNSGGASTPATSQATAIVVVAPPSNTSPPTITGTPEKGQTLTEHKGLWTNSPTTFTFQWLQCDGEGTLASCTNISGATSQTYVPVAGDVGHTIRVREEAHDEGGTG